MAINNVNNVSPIQIPLPPSSALSRANSYSSQVSSSAGSTSSEISAVTAATTVLTTGAGTPPKSAADNKGFTLPNQTSYELSPAQVQRLAELLKARASKAQVPLQSKVKNFVLGAAGSVAQGFMGLANKLGATVGACKQYVSSLFTKKADSKATVKKSPAQEALAEMALEAEINSWHQS